MGVEFPSDSPIQGTGQNEFLEFMARVVGNPDLANEKLWSFETGYLGKFLDDRLSIALDLYYNIHTDIVEFETNIVNKEKNNFCDFFQMRDVFKRPGGITTETESKDERKKNFDDLFND